MRQIMREYNKYAYPGTTDTPTVKVKHALSLIRIVDFVSNTCQYGGVGREPGVNGKGNRSHG